MKLRVARTRKKPYLAWDQAEKIINEAEEPYSSAFRFLLWSGLGEDEFMEIQNSVEIQTAIENRRSDQLKSYIRIDLKPRKSNIYVFYTCVPKQYVPTFPMVTIRYGGGNARGGQPIEKIDLQMNWQRVSERAGLRQIGMGPHTLRSAFSQCGKAGIKTEIAEFVIGHGAVDKYGYRREVQDEAYVVGELTKLWKGMMPVTTEDLRAQVEKEVAEQKEHLVRLAGS